MTGAAIANWIGKLLTVVSIINLIGDANLLKLQKDIAQWVEAYSAFVHLIIEFLFGWIPSDAFNIDDIESHLLVIYSLTTAAMVRGIIIATANYSAGESGEWSPLQNTIYAIFVITLYMIMYSLVFGLFSTPLSIIVATVVVVLFVVQHLMRYPVERRMLRVRAISTQIGSIVALFMLFALGNFLLMQVI